MIERLLNLGIIVTSFAAGVLLRRANGNSGIRGKLIKERIELDITKKFVATYKNKEFNSREIGNLLGLIENRLTIMNAINRDIDKFDHHDLLTRALNYRELKTLLDDFEMHSRYARIYMDIITNHENEE